MTTPRTHPPDSDSPRSSDAARSQLARAIKLSPVFDRASRASRDAVTAAASLETVPASATLFEQGAPAETLVLLAQGRARLERSFAQHAHDGNSVSRSPSPVPLGYRGPGDILGESCLGGVDVRAERAVALEEVQFVRVPITLVRDLITSDAALGNAVFGLLLVKQRETEDRIESMLFRNVEGRLVEFLLKAADRWGTSTPRGTLISVPITHHEIARMIGSTRETVTLTLGALRKAGLLDVDGRKLIVKERDGLLARQ